MFQEVVSRLYHCLYSIFFKDKGGGCLLYLGELMLLLGDLLKIIGIGDEIGYLLQLLRLLKHCFLGIGD